MADTLVVPDDPASLILASGDDVNPNRPLYTGDVVGNVVLPVLQPAPLIVAVVAHPCSMRGRAGVIVDHLHVAPVVAHSESGPQMWRGNFKLMALDAIGDAVSLVNPVVRLDLMTLVASAEVDRTDRLACLDRLGVNILRQRLVHHLTRVVVHVDKFDEEAAGNHEEVDLLEEWLDAAAEAAIDIRDAEAAFHTWLQGDDRQALLSGPATASTVRRAARAEMRQRYPS